MARNGGIFRHGQPTILKYVSTIINGSVRSFEKKETIYISKKMLRYVWLEFVRKLLGMSWIMVFQDLVELTFMI